MLKSKLIFNIISMYMISSRLLFGMDHDDENNKDLYLEKIKNSQTSQNQIHNILDWKDRPENTKTNIELALRQIVRHISSSWAKYNGAAYYDMCGIDDEKLVLKILFGCFIRRPRCLFNGYWSW